MASDRNRANLPSSGGNTHFVGVLLYLACFLFHIVLNTIDFGNSEYKQGK